MMDEDEDNSEKFPGMYRGMVENNGVDIPEGSELQTDEEARGRCQIRVLGVHSQLNRASYIDGIPSANLPWAEQCSPIYAGAFYKQNSGISAVPPVGSWVWVFFDNGDHNKPVYFASIPSMNDFDTAASSFVTVIKTRSGHKITIDDTAGEETGQLAGKITIKSSANQLIEIDDTNEVEKITIKDKYGNKILLDSTPDSEKVEITQLGSSTGIDNKITMDSDGIIIRDVNETKVTLKSTGLEIDALNAGSIEKTVLGESLKSWINSQIVSTYNGHMHTVIQLLPAMPAGPGPVINVMSAMASGHRQGDVTDDDMLSDKNKNN
jgi:hypothetical protein